jgi:hypothetical protein
VAGRQGDAEHGAGVARVDDAVVVQQAGVEQIPGLGLDMTPASCSGPITADLDAGQVNRNRGS